MEYFWKKDHIGWKMILFTALSHAKRYPDTLKSSKYSEEAW